MRRWWPVLMVVPVGCFESGGDDDDAPRPGAGATDAAVRVDGGAGGAGGSGAGGAGGSGGSGGEECPVGVWDESNWDEVCWGE